MLALPDSAVARSRGARWAMAGVTVGVLAADQVTKALVVAGRIPDGSSFGWVSVHVVRNHGGPGGIDYGSPIVATLVVLALTATVAEIMVRTTTRAVALLLAAAIGGALGNLSGRLFRSPGFGRGGVVDWIHFSFWNGTFDLADLALLFGGLGALAVAWHVGEGRRREERALTPFRTVPPVVPPVPRSLRHPIVGT
jgi:signal peptidase II